MLLLCFAAVLLLAVLVSSLAGRTILSTAVLFLVAGFVLGPETTGVLDLQPGSPVVSVLAELALFAVLFTDGMRVGWSDLRPAWRLPGRALGWGLPLTLAITALAAHYIVGLDWPASLRSVRSLPRPTRSSRPLWWATRRCPPVSVTCSMSSRA